jgi:hypothetical protein
MSKSIFKVYGGPRAFNTKSEATVTIDRANNLVVVRPKNYHNTYEMRLEDVAAWVIGKNIKAEAREKILAKRKARR